MHIQGGGKTSFSLHAQQIIDTGLKFGGLALGKDSEVRNFVPRAISKNETWTIRVLAHPFQSQLPLGLEGIINTNEISIDFRVNGAWHDKAFVLPYDGYRDKFGDGKEITIPENGFAPMYFPDYKTIDITGRWFDG